MIFDKKSVELDIDQLKDATHFSLNVVRKDILHSFEWIKHLMGQINATKEELSILKNSFGNMSQSHDAFRGYAQVLSGLQTRIAAAETRAGHVESQVHSLSQHLAKLESQFVEFREIQNSLLERVKVLSVPHPRLVPAVSETRASEVQISALETRVSPESQHLGSRAKVSKPVQTDTEGRVPRQFKAPPAFVADFLADLETQGKVPAETLKKKYVEETRRVSKSTFYRTLGALRDSGQLIVELVGRKQMLSLPPA